MACQLGRGWREALWTGVQEGAIQAEGPVGCRPPGVCAPRTQGSLPRWAPGQAEAWCEVRLEEGAKGQTLSTPSVACASAGPSSSGNSLEMQNLGSSLDLLNHNLHFNKIPGPFIGTLKLCFKTSPL